MKNDIQIGMELGTHLEIIEPAEGVISSEDRNGNGKQKRMGVFLLTSNIYLFAKFHKKIRPELLEQSY